MVFPVVGGNESKVYDVENSLRFNNDDSPKLTFTPSSAGNRRTFTLSVWFKLSVYSTGERVLLAADDGTGGNNNFDYIAINGNDKLFVYGYEGSENQQLLSTQLFRDPSAWYHLVVAFDTTQSTASNRIKAYVNGNQITDFDTANYPSENFQTRFNNNNAQRISSYPDQDTSYFDGYMCEYHLVDGSQLAPTSFGEFDDNGVWIPKKYTGSYGTNGFYLEFKQTGTSANSSGIGADTSGNDNHFTVQNLNAQNVTEDVPTNNFCTFNPRFTGQRGTFSEGNTKLVTNVQGSVNYGQSVIGTFLLTAGKWYWEIEVDAVGSGGNVGIGVNERIDAGIYNNGHNNLGSTGTAFYKSDGNIQIGSGSNISNTSYTSGDIISVALDLDNSRIYWAKNGVYQSNGSGTGNPSTGANPITLTSSYDDGWVVFCSKDDTSNNATFIANFGNYPVAVSSGNTDGKYGIFEYEVPTGFYALCTKRLGEFG